MNTAWPYIHALEALAPPAIMKKKLTENTPNDLSNMTAIEYQN